MIKWQIRSTAFSRKRKPTVSVVEAAQIQVSPSGVITFLDEHGVIVAIIQKDSWSDVVRIP